MVHQSNMSSDDKGVHGRIWEIVPTAEYFWCAAHRLNLVATDAAASVPVAQTVSASMLLYWQNCVKVAQIGVKS